MVVQTSLQKIRATWVERISRELAAGEGVRAGFSEQLERFYELLEQTIISGDTAWLDPILYDWGRSPTETNLEQADYNVSFVLNRMIALTIEVAQDHLEYKDALELLAAVTPVLTHSLSVVIRYEMETRVAHISKELGLVQEKLQTLDQNKSKFISVAAHELKTPLTLIEGYTSMMADLVQNSEQAQMKNYLSGVNTGILRLRDIIDDMIDVSLIDNNLLTLNIQPMWISHLLNLMRNEFKKPIADRRQNLVINEFEGSDMMIYGDSERLYQALNNVVTNAIKYTPDKGTITIDGRMLPGFIEVTVSDTGIGISPENQTLIFDKFGQLGRTDLHSSGKTKFKGGGPGLGLSITRGIIEAHSGTIWVESAGYDEVKLPGSTFHILLPTRTEPSNPVMIKFFGNNDKQKLETETSGKENTPTNDPSA
ncbi:MAG: HAMP domain-containing histidine kinase [Anaerolineales bacterium]|uniref:sensor histidine kinase n=1 Tax=Candidatus Villigracilis vicinus TaxID=3140679 RepID=UPI003136C4B4|nr:HAMP domain-containing histidine kinase [Anaerolineales bacterium]MBK7451823.1 HAMP domain-containing histidine kinase [Anaerolineales bacterium]MBK9781500.1 HAMP domain-containing histidine kinase [Anaerolineales bacterium]